jgi:hypothetical protein
MEPKPRRPRSGDVREDGVSPTGSRAPVERQVERPTERSSRDAPLETYEQPAARSTDDPRQARNEGNPRGTARDEP